MMNRPSSTDPYNVPIMPFASLDLTTTSIQRTSHPLLLGVGDWNSTNTTDTNNPSYNYSSLDCNPALLPLNSFPFYSTPAMAEYPLMAMKREEERGRIGLNLGHRTYFSSGDALAIDRLFGRARGMYELAHQPPRCQAEGCKVDLSGAKHYHRRHKVCEFHSKAAVVIAGGFQQRFCQQCSRFHVLSEFDEAKRSCRKRLADHNRRRRKPRPSTDSSAPKNNTTSSKDKSQHTQKSTKDISTSKASTSASVASTSNASTSLEGQQVYQNKGTQVRNGPALSLGGVEKGNNIGAHGLYQCFSSPSSSSSSFFHHHNLFCSSSNEASQSTGGGSDHTHSHQQSNNNLLHLGQAMFEVDFM